MLEKLQMKMAFKLSARLRFYRTMARQTDNTKRGVKPVLVLQSLIRNEEIGGKRTALSKLYRHIKSRLELGKRLGEVLQEFAPSAETSQIYASEVAGRISQGFIMASEVAKQQTVFKKVFKEALFTPMINLSMAVGIMVLFFQTLVPAMGGSLNPDNVSLLSEVLINIAPDFVYYLSIVGVIVAVLVAWTIWALPNYNGTLRVKLENIPPFSMYRIMTGCSFLYAYTALTKSIAQNQALITIRQFATPYLKLRINKILAQTDRSIGEALLHLKMNFPDKEVINEIAMASEQGVLVEAMPEIVDNLSIDGLELIKLQAGIAKTFATVLMVGSILLLIVGIFTFMNDLQASAGM